MSLEDAQSVFPYYVIFAGIRKDLPIAPMWAVPAESLEEATVLRSTDGEWARVVTPFGALPMSQVWLGVLDHFPEEEDMRELAKSIPQRTKSDE